MQVGGPVERGVADRCDAVWDGHGCNGCAVAEGGGANGGDGAVVENIRDRNMAGKRGIQVCDGYLLVNGFVTERKKFGRPTSESCAPTVCVWEVVNRGEGGVKGVVADGWFVASEEDGCEGGTVFKGGDADGFYDVTEGDGYEGSAVVESVVDDGCNVVWDCV